jgi:hypothetical protein
MTPMCPSFHPTMFLQSALALPIWFNRQNYLVKHKPTPDIVPVFRNQLLTSRSLRIPFPVHFHGTLRGMTMTSERSKFVVYAGAPSAL